MRLSFLLLWAFSLQFALLALFPFDVSAVGSNGASSSGAGTSRGSGEPPVPPVWDDDDYADDLMDVDTHLTPGPPPGPMVPGIVYTTATEEQRYDSFYRLANRLLQIQRDINTLQSHGPLPNVKATHLDVLRKYLERVAGMKQALFLHPTPDRKGRIVAVPMYKLQRLRELLDPNLDSLRKGWAILGVYPAENGASPRIELHAYATHWELHPINLLRTLEASNDVRSLRYFMTHAL